MKIERHYECVDDYLANHRNEWVTIYEVCMYGEGAVDLWYFSSLDVAERSVSNIKKASWLDLDGYIKELQCYVDGAGIVWVRYTHTLDE